MARPLSIRQIEAIELLQVEDRSRAAMLALGISGPTIASLEWRGLAYCTRHSNGLFYRLTDAGRAALAALEGEEKP